MQNRVTADMKLETQFNDAIMKQARREKIADLYRRDDEQYEKELEAMGLAYRRERL